MTGRMAGGTTPPHQPNPFSGNTGDPMYQRPPAFPCLLPTRPAFPCPLLPTPWSPVFSCPFPWSSSCPAVFPRVLCPLFLPLPPSSSPHPCPAPRCLPVDFAGSHSLAFPPAGPDARRCCAALSCMPFPSPQPATGLSAVHPPQPSCPPLYSNPPLPDPISSP